MEEGQDNHVLNVLEGWESELISRRKAARSQSNSTNKGNTIEKSLKEILLRYLPPMFNIGKGSVKSPNDRTNSNSPEIDLVIHRSDFPRIMIDDDCGNYVPESVLAGIEVKTKLKKEHIKKAIEVAFQIKCVERLVITEAFSMLEQIKYFVFAIESDADMGKIATWVRDSANEFLEENPNYKKYYVHRAIDGIFVLEKGSIHLPVQQWSYWYDEPSINNPGVQLAVISMEKHNLGMLLALLMPDRHLMPNELKELASEKHQRFYMESEPKL